MLLTSVYSLFTFAAFVATVIVAAAGAGLLTAEQFDVVYSPFAWACFSVVGCVVEHEQWIEVFFAGRVFLGVFVPRVR